MFDWLLTRVLRLLRVPPAPTPPSGARDSVRIFRAGANLYKLRLLGWAASQIGAAVSLCFLVWLSGYFISSIRGDQVSGGSTPTPAPVVAPGIAPPAPSEPPAVAAAGQPRERAQGAHPAKIINRSAGWMIVLIELAEAGAVFFFLAQLPVTLALVRLDFELHWYIVTDRSLRIRTGLLRLRETTMSFANIQQVTVTQGPLQRLLGLADVRVQSAGGGGHAEHPPGADASLHTGVFHGVANATEIRDLILDRLRQFRATGLGDPDDHPSPVGGVPSPRSDFAPTTAADTLAAARELLHEASALRREITGGGAR